ncbi:MAG: protein translocase subunit SecD [Candidatus Pacebacteria bacterium]|jgi:preprotein translocase subunit SecD|nr:protein translocase subunit SecD [Candidatus Paceibacterota bacterium]
MTNKALNLYFILIALLALIASAFLFPNLINQGLEKIGKEPLNDKGFSLGLDLKGGVHLEYEADLSQVSSEEKENAMFGLRDVIERRVNIYGVTEPIVQIYGNDRIVVELPGVESIEDAISWIGETPLLEFLEEKSEAEIEEIMNMREQLEGLSFEDLDEIEGWELAFESPYNKTELTGKYLNKASVSFDQTSMQPIIELEFDQEGAKIFEEITERNIGKTIAIFLDGGPIIGDFYAPRVDEKISGGKAIIRGDSDIQEVKTIVQRLNQGALPVPLSTPIVQQKVGPTLGQASLENAIKAGIVGLIAIVLFLVLFYKLGGLLASFALLIYILIIFSIIKIGGVTLTLAGIGGIILSIGMAVDGNILIFSRTKEELEDKHDIYTAIERGVDRAWPSIRDGNVTTLIVAIILYLLGTSFVKAFAFTLIIGILVSLFSVMIITRIFLLFFARGAFAKFKRIW